jgi:hypothetical protein
MLQFAKADVTTLVAFPNIADLPFWIPKPLYLSKLIMRRFIRLATFPMSG